MKYYIIILIVFVSCLLNGYISKENEEQNHGIIRIRAHDNKYINRLGRQTLHMQIARNRKKEL